MIKFLFTVITLFLSINLFAQTEDCGNGLDDDGDGLIDCLDPDCTSSSVPTGALFNTATDGVGGVLPSGSNDLNWQFSTGSILGPYTPAIVMAPFGAYYTSPWPDCDWISHNISGTHSVNTDYYYKIEFYLPCINTCGGSYADSATFCLNMDFYADNSVDEVYVNGIAQSPWIVGVPDIDPYYHVGFTAGTGLSMSLCQDWQPGLNVLIIKISSGPGYAGFLAQNSTTAPPTTGDPTILSPFTNYTTCLSGTPITYTAASSGGTWSASCGTCINSTTGVFDPAAAGVGTYTVTYTLTVPCFAQDTALVNVITLADATITAVGLQCTDNAAFNLTAASGGGVWSGTGITNSSLGTFDPATSGTGTFTITYTISGACNDSDTVLITVSDANVTATATPLTCYNYNDGSINAIGSGTGPFTFTITGPENLTNTTGNFLPLDPGNYTVIITNSDGCDDTTTLTINNPAQVIASFTATPTTGLIPLDVATTNTSLNATNYYWDFDNGSNSILANPTTQYDTGGFYVIMLIATNGLCADTAYLTIEVMLPSEITIYNVFSPNGDGVNDNFITTYKNITDFSCMIFDRWGILMFQTTDITKGWNGKSLEGKVCSDGTYFYIIKATGMDHKTYDYSGTVTLFSEK